VTPPKRHKGSSSAIGPAEEQPASWLSVEDDEEYEVGGSEVDDDEENERCVQVHVEITGLKSEEGVNDLTGGKTKVDWYKVVIDNASHNICVDPDDGVEVGVGKIWRA
jgi:hypothetical protein